MHRLAAIFVRNQYLVVDTGILGHHEGNTAFLEEAANDLLGTVLEHFNNLAFPATTVIHLVNPGSYTVTVEHLAHLPRGEKQVGTAIIRNQKPKPSRCPITRPVTRSASSIGRNASRRLQINCPSRHMAISRRRRASIPSSEVLPKLLAQSLMGGRSPPLFQVLENKLPALDGVFVFLSLATGVRVFVFFLPGNHSDPCYLAAILRRNSLSLQYNVGMSNLPNQGRKINRHKYGETFLKNV